MSITAPKLVLSMAVAVLMSVWLIWVSRRSRLPFILTCVFLFGGFASFVLAMAASRLLIPLEALVGGEPDSMRSGLASALLTAALPEELARMVITLGACVVFRYWLVREVVVTCAMIGLGFALYENLLYSLTVPSGIEIGIGRTIPTIFHGTTALIMGSFLARAFSKGQRLRIGQFLLALTVPILLHGLYDFAAYLFEITELPELPDDPSIADLAPLRVPLAIMLLVSSIGLVELIWGGRIVFGLRNSASTQ